MKISKWIISVIVITLPLMLGYVASRAISHGLIIDDMSSVNSWETVLTVWKYLCLPYWLIVGLTFHHLHQKHKTKGLLLFLVPVLFLMTVFILSFTVLDVETRSSFLGMLSQHYTLGFLRLSNNVINIFTNIIDVTYVVILSYVINIIVFLVGYYKLNSLFE